MSTKISSFIELNAVLILSDLRGREPLVESFHALKYAVQFASNLFEGMDLIERYPGRIDVVVVDVRLTGLSIPVLVQFLTRQRRDIKILFWSTEAQAIALEIQEELVLRPSITPESLAEAISEAKSPGSPGVDPGPPLDTAEASFEELLERTHVALLTADINASLNSRADLKTVLEKCAEAVVRHLDTALARIWTLNPADNMLELQASAGLYTHIDGMHARVPLGWFKVGRIAALRQPLQTNSVPQDPEVHDQDWVKREGMVAFAGYPLIIEDQVVGVLATFARRPLSAVAWEALRGVSSHIALGIELKLAELALREDAERLQQITANIDQVVWLTEPATRKVLYISPAFEKMWGRSPQGFLEDPLSIWETVHEEDRVAARAFLKRDSREAGSETFRILRPSGEVRFLNLKTFPVLSGSGDVFRVVGVAADVTEQREMARQLQQAQKMETIGRLAGGVAHDFNNLLTIIMGCCDLLKLRLSPVDPVYPYFESIQVAASRGSSLTQQLLAFGRRQFLQPRAVDLTLIVAEMQPMLERVVGEYVELRVEVQPALWTVKVDPDQMQQVILNLVINARDAMKAGGKLTIALANFEAGGSVASLPSGMSSGAFVTLTVADTGEGMDKATEEKIFEPFFTTKGFKGTGLGLAMVHGTITQSGGSIHVESEPGGGTTFRIFLPVLDAPPEEAPAKAEPREARGTETILLVEDDHAVRALEARVLSSCGYRVLEAANGEEALQICASHSGALDLIVTDMVMPNMSGAEVAKKAEGLLPGVKVLFTSGYAADFAYRRNGWSPGDWFLQKPFRADDLTSKVRSLLDSSPPATKARILVVDDETSIRKVLSEMISAAGWEATEAADGREALEILAKQPIELIVTDLIMPEVEGIELIQAVRQKYPKMKILAVSGADEIYLQVSKHLGADAILKKPLSNGEMVVAMKRLLG